MSAPRPMLVDGVRQGPFKTALPLRPVPQQPQQTQQPGTAATAITDPQAPRGVYAPAAGSGCWGACFPASRFVRPTKAPDVMP